VRRPKRLILFADASALTQPRKGVTSTQKRRALPSCGTRQRSAMLGPRQSRTDRETHRKQHFDRPQGPLDGGTHAAQQVTVIGRPRSSSSGQQSGYETGGIRGEAPSRRRRNLWRARRGICGRAAVRDGFVSILRWPGWVRIGPTSSSSVGNNHLRMDRESRRGRAVRPAKVVLQMIRAKPVRFNAIDHDRTTLLRGKGVQLSSGASPLVLCCLVGMTWCILSSILFN